MSESYAGIDVSKAHLDYAWYGETKSYRVNNDEAGIAQIVRAMEARGTARIVVEATGGLEMGVVAALAAAKQPVALVNPRQIYPYFTLMTCPPLIFTSSGGVI
jgi:transposase